MSRQCSIELIQVNQSKLRQLWKRHTSAMNQTTRKKAGSMQRGKEALYLPPSSQAIRRVAHPCFMVGGKGTHREQMTLGGAPREGEHKANPTGWKVAQIHRAESKI